MDFDLQQDGWPDDEARQRYRRIRARIIEGLIKLAGAEPVPEEMTQDQSKERLSDEGRRRLLEDTLADLKRALADLAGLIAASPPEIPHERGGVARLSETLAGAIEAVEQALREVAAVDAVGKDPDQVHRYSLLLKALALLPAKTHPLLSRLIDEWSPIRKIFVAVHGIGDQFQSETVQTVAYRVCDYVGVPTALPLGRFHGPGGTVTKVFVPDPDRDPPVNCGFAEIYWANVPRVPAADAHILEDPKKWAKSLVERLRLRERQVRMEAGGAAPAPEDGPTKEDDERLKQLIEEMIQGVVVADRLVFLADRAGLFQFNLKKLLNDYLNDVQVVTEFEDYRRQLLEIFDDVLTKVNRYFRSSELYIVAHSEGTVVSFMGLLKGLSERRPWSKMVRGYMTIGSPLNKHVVFWPELFDRYEAALADPANPPIPWKNYFDYGDPIGFNLQMTRDWMKDEGWDRFFTFRNKPNVDDIGFTRYYFPGAAHNDYWRDGDVFGNFIDEVVDPTNAVLPRGREGRYRPPGTRLIAHLTSYPMPYHLAIGLLFVACYVLYKAVRVCLDPLGARVEPALQVFFNVLGLCGIVAGMSVLARMPRLGKDRRWRILACVLAPAFASSYLFFVSPENRYSIEQFLSAMSHENSYTNFYNISLFWGVVAIALLMCVEGLRPMLWTMLVVVSLVLILRVVDGTLSGVLPLTGLLDGPGFGGWLGSLPWRSLEVILIAMAIGVAAWQVSWHYPRVGTKPLVHTGGLIILMVVVTQCLSYSRTYSDRHLALINEGLSKSDRLAVAYAVEYKVEAAFRKLAAGIRVPAAGDRVASDGASGGAGGAPSGCCDTPEEKEVRDAAEMESVVAAAFDEGPIWPVFLAGPAFLYLWWLAILVFDLTFVWHLYIRWSEGEKTIRRRLRRPGHPADQPRLSAEES